MRLAIGKRVPAGRMDVTVTIKSVTEDDTSESGFPVETAKRLYCCAASKEDLGGVAMMGGAEMFKANQLTAPYTTRWVIPYREQMDPDLVHDITKSRRLEYLGREYDITGVTNIGRRAQIEVITLARQG